MISIDLNLDGGESAERIRDGSEAKLLDYVTSINIACGAHAGTRATMEATVLAAGVRGLAIGAHPSYPDKKNFGRVHVNLSMADVTATVYDQIMKLHEVCRAQGLEIHHVKPHGALYNEAAYDIILAEAIANAVIKFSRSLAVVGLAQSKMLGVCESMKLRTIGEGFVDRAYNPHGGLVARSENGALITDAAVAAQQAADIAKNQFVKATDGSLVTVQAKTLCLHSDTPGALAIAKAISAKFTSLGIHAQSPPTHQKKIS